MDRAFIADALTSMTRRELEELRTAIDRQLVECMLCGSEGAVPYMVRTAGKAAVSRAAFMLCKPCFEKHRLPEIEARPASE